MSIIDAVNAKLGTAMALAAATDLKVQAEAGVARNAEEALAARVSALEDDRDSMGAQLVTANAAHANLTARVDALVASLTELGVSP